MDQPFLPVALADDTEQRTPLGLDRAASEMESAPKRDAIARD